ncbi:hypothetical protein Ptr902_09159 [Pyrenophora tritici-repentis]|nr:hypothetical protein Ptr902_09159 [Pyrenophora tritici-repentis]
MEEPIQYPLEPTAVSPFSMDDYAQFKAGGYYTSTNESQSTTSSDKRASPRRISHDRTPSRELSHGEMDMVSSASIRGDQQGNFPKRRDDSYPSLQIPQSLGSHTDFDFGNMGIALTNSPRVSLAGPMEINAVDHAQRPDGGQTSPIMQDEFTSPVEKSCHCKCSQSALACLDRISTVSPEARYIDRLEAIQSALLTAEKLVLCTNCLPNMIIAKCCFVLGNAHELVSDMSSGLEDTTSPTTAATRQSVEYVRRVKRRATMLFAGLKMLEDLSPGDWGLSKMQSEFLSVIAKFWVSLPEH